MAETASRPGECPMGQIFVGQCTDDYNAEPWEFLESPCFGLGADVCRLQPGCRFDGPSIDRPKCVPNFGLAICTMASSEECGGPGFEHCQHDEMKMECRYPIE